MTPPPPAPEEAPSTLAELLENSVVEINLDDKLDHATKRDLEHVRTASLSHGISSMLDRWEETVAPSTTLDIKPIEDDEDPSVPLTATRTTSRQMAAVPAPRPTSRKLEVVQKPITKTYSVQEPIAIVVDTPRRGTTLLILVLALLIAAGLGIALLAL